MTLNQPKPRTQFSWYNERPALFHDTDRHLDYWRGYWDKDARSRLSNAGRKGDLGEFGEVFERHLPKDLPVLEAGCGPAHIVAALQLRGYEAIGVDYEPEVVRYVNETFPELNVREANVLSLDFPSGSLGGYISIGVVEHFVGGPLEAIKEARRILHPRGAAFISVPFANPLRQAYFNTLGRNVPGDRLSFHQYYFNREEFSRILEKGGFEVVEYLPHSVEAFLIREHPYVSAIWKSRVFRDRMKRPIRRVFREAPMWIRNRYAHMLMFICKPV